MQMQNPWDVHTVGRQADGSYDVLIRTRMTVEQMVDLQAAFLGHPDLSENGVEAAEVIQDELMVKMLVSQYLTMNAQTAVPVRFSNPDVLVTPIHRD